MARNNVIPFRRRPPTEQELEAYRLMTRHWSPALRRLMCPRHYEADWREPGEPGAGSAPLFSRYRPG